MGKKLSEGRSMTARQKLFVAEYLIDLNATQAAIRAGYSAKNADKIGSALVGHPSVSAGIAFAMRDRSDRTRITQDRVLEELARIAFFDIRRLYNDDGSMKKPHELDDDAAAVLSGVDVQTQSIGGSGGDEEALMQLITKKAKIFDKTAALTLAMRHLGMLKDKTEVTGANGAPLVPTIVISKYTE